MRGGGATLWVLVRFVFGLMVILSLLGSRLTCCAVCRLGIVCGCKSAIGVWSLWASLVVPVGLVVVSLVRKVHRVKMGVGFAALANRHMVISP
ncbi:hypothetical protein X956_04120 [Trueperella pyogenes TP8]|nr:hypothetical protein X956_04120 [Trueperella pyogenes TP8]